MKRDAGGLRRARLRAPARAGARGSRRTRSITSNEYLERFEARRQSAGARGALGRGRGRAAPDRARAARRARRAPGGEEQVDADGGVRAEPVPREPRHRGHRHRPRRAHRAARPRAAVAHHHAGDPPHARGHRRAVRARARRRPRARPIPRGSPRPRAPTCAAHFLAADAAITGANFAVAETGTLVVVTNEGNADLGMSLPRAAHRLPRHREADARRSATSRCSCACSRAARPANRSRCTRAWSPGRVPGAELHIVLVDNGRTRLLADDAPPPRAGCIRCGACLNTCPVYRRAGGHAYGWAIPGPIGVGARARARRRHAKRARLPLASTLCGSCSARVSGEDRSARAARRVARDRRPRRSARPRRSRGSRRRCSRDRSLYRAFAVAPRASSGRSSRGAAPGNPGRGVARARASCRRIRARAFARAAGRAGAVARDERARAHPRARARGGEPGRGGARALRARRSAARTSRSSRASSRPRAARRSARSAPAELSARVAERCRSWAGGGRVLASDAALAPPGQRAVAPVPTSARSARVRRRVGRDPVRRARASPRTVPSASTGARRGRARCP